MIIETDWVYSVCFSINRLFSIYEFMLCNDNSLMQALDTIYFKVVSDSLVVSVVKTCIIGLHVLHMVH
jgi:hypothetical protein